MAKSKVIDSKLIDQEIKQGLNHIKERVDILSNDLDGTQYSVHIEEIDVLLEAIKTLEHYRTRSTKDTSVELVVKRNPVSEATDSNVCRITSETPIRLSLENETTGVEEKKPIQIIKNIDTHAGSLVLQFKTNILKSPSIHDLRYFAILTAKLGEDLVHKLSEVLGDYKILSVDDGSGSMLYFVWAYCISGDTWNEILEEIENQNDSVTHVRFTHSRIITLKNIIRNNLLHPTKVGTLTDLEYGVISGFFSTIHATSQR